MPLYFSKAIDFSQTDILSIRRITIADNCCNEKEVTELDLSGFVNLKSFAVGNCCFANVVKCSFVGMHELEDVNIGKGSFTKAGYKTTDGVDPNRHFHLRKCEKIQTLLIGDGSFLDYSVCDIVDLPSLRSVTFESMYTNAKGCFYWASLEVKSD